jgi:hypothetical protein
MALPVPITNRVGAKKIPLALHNFRARDLFFIGYDTFDYDTFDIAAHFRATEAEILKLISEQRSAERGLRSPYEYRPARLSA